MFHSLLVACGRVDNHARTSVGAGAGVAAAPDAGGEGADAGEGGSGGEPESDTGITITGTLVDSWRRPAAGCLVALGTATALTGSLGEFHFEHVAPPYDIAFTIPGVPNLGLWAELWLYTGLTRADPTLQFDRVLVNQQTLLSVQQTNIPMLAAAAPAKLRRAMSFAAPGLELGASDLEPLDDSGEFLTGGFWAGGSSISGTMHSLAWLSPSGDPAGLDLQFLSYQERPYTLSDDPSLGPIARVTLDFSPNAVPTETYPVAIRGEPISGTVLHSEVVFESNAAIWLSERENPEGTINVPMPVLPGGHAVFSAVRSSPQSGASFVHHRADSSGSLTALTMPTPRTLTAPDADAANVTATTRFVWSDGASVSTLDVHCWKSGFDLHVVTAANSATCPVVPALASRLPANDTCQWSVGVHGAFARTDDAAGPSGFLDGCAYPGERQTGPLLDDGFRTRSSWRAFTTAP
ncbi:MAG TPA: hypothetical protein VER12_05320 [Polyangiaceae bacterium]|nr:hypothetical protein [Polyangiaceae bacterium]